MREERNPYRTLFIWTLVVLIVLILVGVYLFAVKPAINGYVVNKQMQASDYIIGTIFNQVQQQGYVQLSYLNESVILVPYTPPVQ